MTTRHQLHPTGGRAAPNRASLHCNAIHPTRSAGIPAHPPHPTGPRAAAGVGRGYSIARL
jgi:hypothetical protein